MAKKPKSSKKTPSPKKMGATTKAKVAAYTMRNASRRNGSKDPC